MQAIKAMEFSAGLVRTARKIITALTSGNARYACVHLRVELDFILHPDLLGDTVHRSYCTSAVQCLEATFRPVLANLSRQVPIYIASGILANEPLVGHAALTWLEGLGFTTVYASSFSDTGAWQRLHQEEMAAVNAMVCAQADVFVGTPLSSFSALVSQYKQVHSLGGETVFIRPVNHANAWLSELAP